jgi:hypothetical protein
VKRRFVYLLLIILIVGCSRQKSEEHTEFPLYKGTTWVYTYQAYEPSGSNIDSAVKATYQLTETVADVATNASYSVAHVVKEFELDNADVGWTGDFTSNQNEETWYVVDGEKIYSSNQPVEINKINVDNLNLTYDFPLSVNKVWCPMQFDLKNPNHKPITNCQFSGQREVTGQGSFESPAGKFKDCYYMTDHFNGGNIFQKFCVGVGIVSMKFDHMGTPFGFEQTLIRYSIGMH